MASLIGVCALFGTAHGETAQDRTKSATAGERIIAVVPLVGSGTPGDPQRPMFAPKPSETVAALAQGKAPQFVSYHYVITDDGTAAIVEFVAASRAAFRPLFDASKAGAITAYDPHVISRDALVLQLQQRKASFDWFAFRGLPAPSTGSSSIGGAN
jgi:hypothetical protein